MPTTEALQATIGKVEDLYSIVKTMKALAAVSIRQYEQAVSVLEDYNRIVEMGLQIVLNRRYFAEEFPPLSLLTEIPGDRGETLVLVFGSDQGLCGQFNQQIAADAIAGVQNLQIPADRLVTLAIGGRVVPALESQGYDVAEQFSLPHSAQGIADTVLELLLALDRWRSSRAIGQILLFYNRPTSGASYQSHRQQLLPLDPQQLRDIEARSWPSTGTPIQLMELEPLFWAIVRQYLFVSLYRALAASLASENASRLASMQSAQRNIEERLDDLNAQYRRQRQSAITAELLDVVSGFEALS